jgi:hypothetical protein
MYKRGIHIPYNIHRLYNIHTYNLSIYIFVDTKGSILYNIIPKVSIFHVPSTITSVYALEVRVT